MRIEWKHRKSLEKLLKVAKNRVVDHVMSRQPQGSETSLCKVAGKVKNDQKSYLSLVGTLVCDRNLHKLGRVGAEWGDETTKEVQGDLVRDNRTHNRLVLTRHRKNSRFWRCVEAYMTVVTSLVVVLVFTQHCQKLKLSRTTSLVTKNSTTMKFSSFLMLPVIAQ